MSHVPAVVQAFMAVLIGLVGIFVVRWAARPLASLWDTPKIRHSFHFSEDPMCDRCHRRWLLRQEKRRHVEMIRELRKGRA
jgi:hypothetical protein